eukprot:CAMPEP_0172554354 /NCGR_PEP_ID=MMETSP1067-20121228/54171_1 /TAXON_ID=265564 ORGANISM="Thalassiosira punctigera, Strain Tpunct2005C2" /NCGR_SAMPLE_ID=MMETSP1067 /ASSEMBLY_ACC=CAM_ASM_000444 /LENGTH=419 /DNA_ID=CAMNT_0013342705 /DNA_START=105 /DNA_END=1364 /DNA_ORIENTATION=+
MMMNLARMLLLAPISRSYAASASSCFISTVSRYGRVVLPSSAIQRHGAKSTSRLDPYRQRLFSKSSSDEGTDQETERELKINVSRLSTLHALLSSRGAPGSIGCNQGNGDLVPVPSSSSSEYQDLHPHLLPLAKSESSGNIICALRRAYADDADYDSPSLLAPWPIVESGVGLPGMRLLSLNSEHLMRRIAADADANLEDEEAASVVGLYNEGLGEGKLADKSLDALYQTGSVDQLGYGLEKYVLLRVGPFPDLYETMSNQHLARGDEESSLIAAEASNGKFGGFGSTFAFYAKLLGSLSRREEECRDAARMTLRMPLPSMGLTRKDFVGVARMAGFAGDDDGEDPLAKMLEMYEKIREHERDENSGDKTPKQTAMEDANYLLDVACLTGQRYGEVRGKIADIYRAAGMEDDARFVERC